MKKLLRIIVAAVLAVSLAVPVFGGVADDLNDANNRQKELEQEVSDSQSKLEELKNSKASIEKRIAEIDSQISDVNAVIEKYQAEADTLDKEIDELESKIDEKEDEILEKYEKMKVRIKYMYENMDADYLEAIFSSTSIGEFFQKVQYIASINSYDRTMMEKIAAIKKEIEDDKSDVEDKLATVNDLKGAQEEQKAVLDDLQALKQTELENTEAAIAAEIAEIEALNQMLEENAAEIDSLSKQYDAMIAEQKKQQNNSGSDSNNSGSGEVVIPTGSWIWPLPGYTYISSGFGERDGGFHAGIDIPAPEGTTIIAVDSGQVVMARWGASDDTGLYVVIYHGDGVYSEYMHMSNIYVSAGQVVSQSEAIGAVGNTGESYGAHLHLSKGLGSQYWLNRVAPF